MAKETYMGIPIHRTFGGKRYEYHSRYKRKADAKAEAKSLSISGRNARVIPTPKSVLKYYPESKWLIYSRDY